MTPCQTLGCLTVIGVGFEEPLPMEEFTTSSAFARLAEEPPFPMEEGNELQRWLDLNA